MLVRAVVNIFKIVLMLGPRELERSLERRGDRDLERRLDLLDLEDFLDRLERFLGRSEREE